MTAADADGIGLRWKVRELQIEYRAVPTNLPSGLVDVVRMAKHSITLEEQIRDSDGELRKSQLELQVARDAV